MLHKVLTALTMLLLIAPQVVDGKSCKLKAVEHVIPRYPAVAAAATVPGVVYVRVSIDETGRVIKAQVRSGHKLLNDAALKAAKQWRFTSCGHPQSAELVFRFEIGKPGESGTRLEPIYRAPFTVIVKAPYPRDNVQ